VVADQWQRLMQADPLRLITEVCARAAAGDFEARLPPLGDSAETAAARLIDDPSQNW